MVSQQEWKPNSIFQINMHKPNMGALFERLEQFTQYMIVVEIGLQFQWQEQTIKGQYKDNMIIAKI